MRACKQHLRLFEATGVALLERLADQLAVPWWLRWIRRALCGDRSSKRKTRAQRDGDPSR
jgi:hypothetical protein